MHEILRNLAPGSRVLDLGSGRGSFPADAYQLQIVRLDMDRYAWNGSGVQAAAHRLPFANASFDAVVANHSLEHVEHLDQVLHEIGRVTKPAGSLYASVPDAGTFADRLYRWLSHGGGHINPFRDSGALGRRIETAVGLPHRATRLLLSSLSFMNRAAGNRPPLRAWLFGGGNETFLKVWSRTARALDRTFGSRLSVYGWAFYFGEIGEEVEPGTWSNVCVHCGAGHSSASLTCGNCVHGRRFVCPNCGTWNYFTED